MHNLNIQLVLIGLLVVAVVGGQHLFLFLILIGLVWLNLRARAEYADALDALRERLNDTATRYDLLLDKVHDLMVFAFELSAKHQMKMRRDHDTTYFGRTLDVPGHKPRFVPLFAMDREGIYALDEHGQRIDAA